MRVSLEGGRKEEVGVWHKFGLVLSAFFWLSPYHVRAVSLLKGRETEGRKEGGSSSEGDIVCAFSLFAES